MTLQFWINIAAILLGPLFGVFVTIFYQERRAKIERRMGIFRSLMSTRKTPLSPERVQALNLVEVEFRDKPKVQKAFKELLELYNDTPRWRSGDDSIRQQLHREVDVKSTALLGAIAEVLGHKAGELDLYQGGYNPEVFNEIENQQHQIRELFSGLNSGKKSFPVAVVDVRHSEAILKQVREASEIGKSVQSEEKDDE